MKLADFLKNDPETITRFAERVGVSRQAVHRWASGRRTPRPAQMVAIVAATDGKVRPNDFFVGDDAARNGEAA